MVTKSEWSFIRLGETFSQTAFNLSLRYLGIGKITILLAQEFAQSSL